MISFKNSNTKIQEISKAKQIPLFAVRYHIILIKYTNRFLYVVTLFV